VARAAAHLDCALHVHLPHGATRADHNRAAAGSELCAISCLAVCLSKVKTLGSKDRNVVIVDTASIDCDVQRAINAANKIEGAAEGDCAKQRGQPLGITLTDADHVIKSAASLAHKPWESFRLDRREPRDDAVRTRIVASPAPPTNRRHRR